MRLPLLLPEGIDRPVAWRGGRPVSAHELLRDARALARQLSPAGYVVNLCEERYAFLVTFCAAILRGGANLLPSSRAQEAVDAAVRTVGDAVRCDDAIVQALLAAADRAEGSMADLQTGLEPDQIAVVAFTSGSTGEPSRHVKRWGSFWRSNAFNTAAVRAAIAEEHGDALPWIVATVPPQHMYGLETSILMPLLGTMGVHAGRPLFPADVATALESVPQPRVLVSTPVHLRALLESGVTLPSIAVVVSATAPLDAALAGGVERRWRTAVVEMFGSTETCVIATRRTASEQAWRAYPGVTLEPQADSTKVNAPWFAATTLLQDVIGIEPEGGFVVRGRNVDMIEVAGKRASLGDLTRRLLAIPGVEDAVVFQPDATTAGEVRRVAALVVAPTLQAESIAETLARGIDPAFVPRPLALVPALPRNEVGKIPRAALLAALRSAHPH